MTEISRTPNYSPTPGDTCEPFALSDFLDAAARTVPLGADIARVVHAIQSFGSPTNQQVFIDPFELTAPTDDDVVPAPWKPLLFAAGLLAAGPVRLRSGPR